VVFDLGKVLLDFDYGLAVRRLAAGATVDLEEVRRLLVESTILPDYESGKLDSPSFFEQLGQALGLKIDYQGFRAAFADIFAPIPEMIEVQARLRAAAVPTYILSNTNEIAVSHIRDRYPFFNGFDGYIFSHEVGCLKPLPPIYEALERLARRSGRQLFYLDDRQENVDAALSRGWRAVVHSSPAATRALLREAGFLA